MKKHHETAWGIVNGDRKDHYDSPENNFQRIAHLWNGWLKARGFDNVDLQSRDVAHMMIQVKQARDIYRQKDDNEVDMMGYTMCLQKTEPFSK